MTAPLRDWNLRLLVTHGEHEKAQRLLDAYNRFATAFGREPFAMPEPCFTPMEGLETCPAIVDVERGIDPETGRDRVAA